MCMADDSKSMSILICMRSNWQWQVKQKIGPFDFAETKGIRAMQWMANKKQQLFFSTGSGMITYIDFHFLYDTSLKSFNQKNEKNLAYTCFITNNILNLTPLGRFLMPPPMSEKQVKLDGVPVHLDMHGHLISAMLETGEVALVDCINHESINILKFEHDGHQLTPSNVSKMVLYR